MLDVLGKERHTDPDSLRQWLPWPREHGSLERGGDDITHKRLGRDTDQIAVQRRTASSPRTFKRRVLSAS